MTGGVVRRDGLREKFARVLEQHWVEYVDEQCGFECGCNEHGGLHLPDRSSALAHQAEQIARVLDAVPDVPPDPPAVDLEVALALREKAARVLHAKRKHDCSAMDVQFCGVYNVALADADALLSSGVLADAAHVRASAEEAALQVVREAVNQADVRREDGLRTRDRIREAVSDYATRNVYRDMRDRAVSEREGGGSDG